MTTLLGIKKIRVGFRPDVAARDEAELAAQQSDRRQKTPLQRAKKELLDAFESYAKSSQDITDVLVKEFTAEALLIDTVTTMNMNTLATTMVYLYYYPEPEPEDFTDEILEPFLDNLMENFSAPPGDVEVPTSELQEEVRYHYKQTLFRYIKKVHDFRKALVERKR